MDKKVSCEIHTDTYIHIYTCNETLLSHKKEGNLAISNNLDLEGIMLSEIRERYQVPHDLT